MHIRLTPLNERKPLTKDSSFEELGTNGQKEGRNIRQKSFFFFQVPPEIFTANGQKYYV